MSAPVGQAPRRIGWHWVGPACHMVLAGALLIALALGVLAWRLGQGPLGIPLLAQRIEAGVNDREDGLRVEIGRAAIAWEGFRNGFTAPLDIRLQDVRLHGLAGAPVVELADAAATLSFRALLRGVLAPAAITLLNPRLEAVLAPDGSIAIGPPGEAGAAGGDPLAPLRPLMRPASDRSAATSLRRLRIHGGSLSLSDPATGRRWTLAAPQLDLRRAAAGGLAGEGSARLESGASSVQVRLDVRAEGTPMRLSAGISLPALRPAELAGLWPPLAPLGLVDALVSLTAHAEFDGEGRPVGMRAALGAGAGAFDLGPGPDGTPRRLPFAGLALATNGTARALRLETARLTLPGAAPGTAGPSLTARGELLNRDGAWNAALDLAAEPIEAAELPRLWPAGISPEARTATLAALPAGLLREARLQARFRVPEAMDDLVLEDAQLGLAIANAVFDLGRGRRIAAESAEVALSGSPDHLRLDRAVLRLPRLPRGGPAPVLQATGAATRAAGLWRGGLDLRLDRLAFADLPSYWPRGLGSPKGGERDWIIRNITGGEVHNGRWHVEAEAPAGAPDSLRVTGLSGTAEAADATVHWLRPIPPATGVAGSAEFSLSEITLRARAGRQGTGEAGRAGLDLRGGTVRFLNLDAEPSNAEIGLQVAGGLADALVLLKHPRLKLFERQPLKLQVAGGTAEARLDIAFPLVEDLPIELLRIKATARLADARLPGLILDQDLDHAAIELAVDTDGLRASGQGSLLGAPVRVSAELDFRRGPPNQVSERATLAGRLDARQIATLGFDAVPILTGPVALEARTERRRNGQGQAVVRGDLAAARLGLEALNWAKPPGMPGTAEATIRLQGDSLAAVDSFRVESRDLSLRGAVRFGAQSRLQRVEITESLFAGSRLTGEALPPERGGAPWTIALRGPLLDLRTALGPPDPAAHPPPTGEDAQAPPLLLDLRFDRVTMGEDRNLLGLQASARTDSRGVVREARATGRTAPRGLGPTAGRAPPGAFEASLTPRGPQRLLSLTAEDGGGLLNALDLVNEIQGGRLTVTGLYREARPGAPLSGTAELTGFVLRDAPAAAKLLQAMTLYGLVEAARGHGGLVFSRLVAPFTLTPEALTLADARAFSASLGVTAKGRILRERAVAEIEGTIVPAYVFNTLLGNLPLVGRLFSPEAGGGVFAATYRIQGALSDPAVTVNPLAALTPGFLRGLFGLFEGRGEEARRGGAPAEPAWDGRGPPPR